MQTQLLEKDPTPNLRVYAIWLPMLWSDGRSMWNGRNMLDNRVIHYWDGDRTVGRWFAEHSEGYEGIVWDTYYLYGPDSETCTQMQFFSSRQAAEAWVQNYPGVAILTVEEAWRLAYENWIVRREKLFG